MIQGRVNTFKQAIVALTLHYSRGRSEDVAAIIDTGFDGFITLSPDVIARLRPPLMETRPYELGDGSTVDFDVYFVRVTWDGQNRDVEALVTNGGALIGMSLLTGYMLFIDAIDGGEVRIELRS